MSEFAMTVGLPACGKTTWANNQSGYMVLSSDSVRKELYGDESIQGDANKVFEIMQRRAVEYLRNGQSVIYDATNLSGKRRRHMLGRLKNIDGITTKCEVFVAPIEICKTRNTARERVVPDYMYDKMLRQYNVPQYFEGWDEIEIMWDMAFGQWEYPPRPDSLEIMAFDQSNSHHDMTLGEHLSAAYKYLIDASRSTHDIKLSRQCERLADVAFYHDIGKYYTKDFHDSHGRVSVDAHYYGHENYGAYIYLLNILELCEAYGTSYNREVLDREFLKVAGLINCHMRPFAWEQSDKARQKDRALIGEKMYNNLMLLHEADIHAKKLYGAN